MLTVPFLTDLDPQLAVKGSRDPLGVQTIWARLGRHVVGNHLPRVDYVLGIAYPKTASPGAGAVEKTANSQGSGVQGMALAVKQSVAPACRQFRSAHALAPKIARDEIADPRCHVGALRSRSSRGPEPT